MFSLSVFVFVFVSVAAWVADGDLDNFRQVLREIAADPLRSVASSTLGWPSRLRCTQKC